MIQLLLVLHVLICAVLVVLILIQQGKGAEMGAAFGSGASQTLFGSQGSGSFLMKVTGLFAALFFVTSLGLGYIVGHQSKQDNIVNSVVDSAAQVAQQIPATTSSAQDQVPQSSAPQDQIPGSPHSNKKGKN